MVPALSMSLYRQQPSPCRMHPWPTATTLLDGEPFKIHAAQVIDAGSSKGRPGEVIRSTGEGIDVACGQGVLRLVEVQAPGRKRMPVRQFLVGTKVGPGQKFGNF